MTASASTAASASSLAPIGILDPEGQLLPGAEDPRLEREQLLAMYRGMLRIRVLDERMLALQRQGRIGFVGTATGQEASVVGSAAGLAPSDWIFPGLREGGAALFRGMPLEEYVGQMYCNTYDTAKGRQMCNHFQHQAGNFVSWSSVIGTQLPQAVGAAFAAKLRGERTVCAAYLGDGATSSGGFHCAATFAGVWKAPVVFLIIDNGWAISVPACKQSAAASLALKGKTYGLPSRSIDGNDLFACYVETRAAVERVRAGGAPEILHLKTYRMMGHSSSDDPTRYRDAAEVEAWSKRDPIARAKRYLEGRAWIDDARDAALREELDAEIRGVIKTVEAAAPMALSTLVEDVYAEVPAHLRRQYNAFLESARKHGDARPSDVPFPL
ncbi:MAG: 3-methyl-2-oxobutanoate dehydrogenase [Planctomycetes bacterium]|nr:3-methyl-2-oxobutanoate dehydrogenase [Planctomycetota bacterium]